MLYRVHLTWAGFELTTLVVIGTDCIDKTCKSNYHMIKTTTVAINKFKLATYSCMFQARTWISISICYVLFVFNDLRWDVIVRLVDISWIVDHHSCLSFLFIVVFTCTFVPINYFLTNLYTAGLFYLLQDDIYLLVLLYW